MMLAAFRSRKPIGTDSEVSPRKFPFRKRSLPSRSVVTIPSLIECWVSGVKFLVVPRFPHTLFRGSSCSFIIFLCQKWTSIYMASSLEKQSIRKPTGWNTFYKEVLTFSREQDEMFLKFEASRFAVLWLCSHLTSTEQTPLVFIFMTSWKGQFVFFFKFC